jgi:hypothetical protein
VAAFRNDYQRVEPGPPYPSVIFHMKAFVSPISVFHVVESGLRREAEEEGQEGMIEGTLNPQSQRKAPFNPSPTI